jgi:transcriptional regulator with XRE-family HTH domain
MQGDELRAMRKALGMTQAAMGDALGVSGVYVGMMERGEYAIERRTELAVRYLMLTSPKASPA